MLIKPTSIKNQKIKSSTSYLQQYKIITINIVHKALSICMK